MAKYTEQDRRDLASKGQALPDGSFPIADVEDLKSAIRNWALGKQPDVAKKFIMKRAKALNAEDVIPDKWKTAQHSATSSNEFLARYGVNSDADDFLAHFGVVGMKWGQRKQQFNAGGSTRRERNQTEARRQIANSGGSKTKAIIKTLGKGLGLNLLAGVGGSAFGVLSANSSVAIGASKVATLFAAANSVSTVVDVARIATSKPKSKSKK